MTKKKEPDEPLAKFLTSKELAQRDRCIQVLKNFKNSYEAAARAFHDVKEQRLYRPYSSIREFCEKECGWSIKRFYQLVQYTKVKSKLPPSVGTMVHNERIA